MLLKEAEKELSKLLPTRNRNKRGLVNGLGKIIKFISGNLDQEDYDTLEAQITALQSDRDQEIRHVNKLVSFSNSITHKFVNEMNHINLNMGLIQQILSKQDFKVDLLEQYQYTTMCLRRFLKILRTLENTISLSFHDITNVQLFSNEDVTNVMNHLYAVYPVKSIVHSDPYHVFENLKFTKSQVVIIDQGLVVILSVPTTDGNNYHLYAITPVPTINNVVLIPSERNYLQGPTSKWSTEDCIKGTLTYVCANYNVRVTSCNLTKTTGCDFAQVTNDVKLFQLLNKNDILFFSSLKEIVIQTCNNNQTSVELQGSYLIYSNVNCPISAMSTTLEPKSTTHVMTFPLVYVYNEHDVKLKIQFHPSHLDVNKLKLDLIPITPTPILWKQFNVVDIGFVLFILCFVCYVCRKMLYKVLLKLVVRREKKQIPEDGEADLVGEDLYPHVQSVQPVHSITQCTPEQSRAYEFN